MPRPRSTLALLVAAFLLLAYPAHGRSYSRGSHGSTHHSYSTSRHTRSSYGSGRPHASSGYHYRGTSSGRHSQISSTHHTSCYAYGAPRDSHGRIKRSEAAKHRFEKQTGYPHGRKGYVVDHIVPLSKRGKGDPGNMQWQTNEEAKAKDREKMRIQTRVA